LNNAPANVKDEIEPGFVNDNYWFIFPFHVYWDTSAAVTVKEKQKLPLANGTATLVSVKYPAEAGGYTPGDTWDLFLGSDGRVKEFTYHRGGPKKPSLLSTTWAGYKKAGPLLVSTDHRGMADGKAARIFFTNVAVKLRSEEHTSELQSLAYLVCRLLLEKSTPLRELHSFPTRRSSDLGRMGELRNSPTIAVDRRNRVSSPPLGQATRKPARCLSQPTIAGWRTARRLEYSLRMWPSS